ncbi:MAG: acyclic terpene utilization AtuA family protein [Planctomycetales bacterium]|nr:acyclic terpene utilization AtuA family protein [Planctomycetales bacterium]
MRFARVPAADGRVLRGLVEFASASELDLLQLDYHRHRSLPASSSGEAAFSEFAHGIEVVIGALGKQFYLDPRLHVVADAGWCDAYACVEAVAGELASRGNKDVLVSAVRGSNLMPILDMLIADGVNLKNVETNQSWRELKAPLLAADLKLGAGPLAMALADGARVVITGSYDGAAPVAAFAANSWDWEWSDHNRLAGAAAAAQAAIAPHFGSRLERRLHGEGQLFRGFAATIGELEPDGSATLWTGALASEADAERLTAWLDGRGQPALGVGRADAKCDFQRVRATATSQGALHVEGAQGDPPRSGWDLEILYQTGYAAEALAVAEDSDAETLEELEAWLHARLVPLEDSHASLAIRKLQESASGSTWFHVEYRTPQIAACEAFVSEVRAAVRSCHGALRWVSRPPSVLVECGVWPAWVPRDAIDLAVDTRTAEQWQ